MAYEFQYRSQNAYGKCYLFVSVIHKLLDKQHNNAFINQFYI